MGYYVSLDESNAVIPAEKLETAFTRMKALNRTHDHAKTGGSWSGGRQTERWFAWMTSDYDKTCKDAAEILGMVGFDCAYGEDGSLRVWGYDSKTGQEDLFIETIADLFVPGSYMVWRGEDGAQWRWEFDGTKKMKYQSAHITWQ